MRATLAAAAVSVARYRLGRQEKHQKLGVAVFAFAVLVNAIGITVEHSGWYVAGAAVFVWLLVSTRRDPVVQRRRIARLEADSA